VQSELMSDNCARSACAFLEPAKKGLILLLRRASLLQASCCLTPSRPSSTGSRASIRSRECLEFPPASPEAGTRTSLPTCWDTRPGARHTLAQACAHPCCFNSCCCFSCCRCCHHSLLKAAKGCAASSSDGDRDSTAPQDVDQEAEEEGEEQYSDAPSSGEQQQQQLMHKTH
jgi:hypothetical protein